MNATLISTLQVSMSIYSLGNNCKSIPVIGPIKWVRNTSRDFRVNILTLTAVSFLGSHSKSITTSNRFSISISIMIPLGNNQAAIEKLLFPEPSPWTGAGKQPWIGAVNSWTQEIAIFWLLKLYFWILPPIYKGY